jgi:hypothetical protein
MDTNPALSVDLKDFFDLGAPVRVDDVIVQLHTTGETFFQAVARASAVPGADTSRPDLFKLVSERQVPLKSGKLIELPPLHTAGVATICRFEIESAEYDQLRPLTDEPTLEREPRVPSETLWPALQAVGVATKLDPRPIHVGAISRAALAAATGIGRRLIDRVCSGEQKTIRISHALDLLEHIGERKLARELEARLSEWHDHQMAAAFDEVEYLDALGRFAFLARHQPLLTPDEQQALDDIVWMFWEMQRETFLGVTPRERLDDVQHAFREAHARDPTPLSQRLRRQARAMFLAEARERVDRAKGLRKGLHHSAERLSTSAIHGRIHRLRRRGLLSPKSKPIAFKPQPGT